MGFTSIGYDQLAAWRDGDGDLPPRPIMWDCDHPVKGILGIGRVLEKYGMAGNLFVNTGLLREQPEPAGQVAADRGGPALTWDEIRGLRDAGWSIGAHTVTHPNLSALVADDPEGTALLAEFDENDAEIEREIGAAPTDFAFTSTTWSSVAESLVAVSIREI